MGIGVPQVDTAEETASGLTCGSVTQHGVHVGKPRQCEGYVYSGG